MIRAFFILSARIFQSQCGVRLGTWLSQPRRLLPRGTTTRGRGVQEAGRAAPVGATLFTPFY